LFQTHARLFRPFPRLPAIGRLEVFPENHFGALSLNPASLSTRRESDRHNEA
jgi:hypothetical protein